MVEASGRLTIGQVARAAGLRTSTLRYYETLGLLASEPRVNGQRRYAAEVVQRLALIGTAQQAGFTLSEIRILLDEILRSTAPTVTWRTLVQRKQRELDRLLADVQSMRGLLAEVSDCADPELADCIYATGQRYQQRQREG